MDVPLFNILDFIMATSSAIRNISEDVPCILPKLFYQYTVSSPHWIKMEESAPFIAYFIKSFDETDATRLVTHIFNSFIHICKKVRCIQGVTKSGCVWPILERDIVTLVKLNIIEMFRGPSESDSWQKRFTVVNDVKDENPGQYTGHWFVVTFWICLRTIENIYVNAVTLSELAGNYVFIPAVIEALTQLGPKGAALLSKIWNKDSMGLSIISVTYSASWAVLGVDKRHRKQQHYNFSSNDIGVRRQYADSQLYKTILCRIIATRIILSGELEDTNDAFVKYANDTNVPIDIITEVLYAFMIAREEDSVESSCRTVGLHHIIPSLSTQVPSSLVFLHTIARDCVEAHSGRFIRQDEPNCSIPYHSIFLLLTSSGVFQRLGELVQWHAAYHVEKKTVNTRHHIISTSAPMEPLFSQRLKILITSGYTSISDGYRLLEHPHFDKLCHFFVPITHCSVTAALFSMARFIRDSKLSSDMYPVYPYIESSWYTGSGSPYSQTNFIEGCDAVLVPDGEEDDNTVAAAQHEFSLLKELNEKLSNTGMNGIAPLVSDANNTSQNLQNLVERLLSIAKSRITASLVESIMDVDAVSRIGKEAGELPRITAGFVPGRNIMFTRCLNGCVVSMAQPDADLFSVLSIMLTRLGEKKVKCYTGPMAGILYKLYKTDRRKEDKAMHRTTKSIIYQYTLASLLTTVKFGASHTLAYVSQDYRPMDLLHRNNSLVYIHQDISGAMLEHADEVVPEDSSLIESPIDFYELYLERLVDIIFPTPQSVVDVLKEAIAAQFVYMSAKTLKNREAPPLLKTIVLFFLHKLATRIPKTVASRLKSHFQNYIFSTEYTKLDNAKKRVIATAYCVLEHSMIPYSEEYFSIPRSEDIQPSYCFEVEPIGILFAATIECPTMNDDEKRELISQIEAIREIQMAAPQALGSWVYSPDDIMTEYNRLYGNDKYQHILHNPSLREAWMDDQPRLGLLFLALEILNGLSYSRLKPTNQVQDIKLAAHFDTLGSFKPDFRKWEEWNMGDLLKSSSTCGRPFFTNMHVNNKFRQILASPLSLSILSSASVSIYANMLQE